MARTPNTPTNTKRTLTQLIEVLRGYENIPLTLSIKSLRAIEDVLGVDFSLESEAVDTSAPAASGTPAGKAPSDFTVED
jgi:hypothetical protein